MHRSRLTENLGDRPPTAAVRKRLNRSVIAALTLTIALAAFIFRPEGAVAQGKTTPADSPSTQPVTARTNPNEPMLWDVEAMMEDAVQQISRRYNLTKEQEEYTRVFLKKRVREFLDKYETDVRELLQESINIRTGKTTDPGALADWAIRAMPVYDAATKAILDGNKEWGVILDDKQKETHEKDLRLMDANFSNVNRTLNTWAEGKGNTRSMTGVGQGTGSTGQAQRPIRNQEIEDAWIAYVNQFINAYNLDEAKKIAAREKIHKDQYDKAKLIREANKDKFRTIENEQHKLGGLPAAERAKKRVELNKRKLELEKPIYKLFVEMSRRLETLPTSKQRAEVTPEAKKSLEALYKRLSGEFETEAKSAARESSKKDADQPTTQSADKNAADEKPDASQPQDAGKTEDAPTTQKS